jgi:hypothetical protein
LPMGGRAMRADVRHCWGDLFVHRYRCGILPFLIVR